MGGSGSESQRFLRERRGGLSYASAHEQGVTPGCAEEVCVLEFVICRRVETTYGITPICGVLCGVVDF